MAFCTRVSFDVCLYVRVIEKSLVFLTPTIVGTQRPAALWYEYKASGYFFLKTLFISKVTQLMEKIALEKRLFNKC